MPYTDTLYPSLKFMKSGDAIIKAANSKLLEFQASLEKIRTQVVEICKVRGIEPEEVLDAGNDEDRISAYSDKISNNVAGSAGVSGRAKLVIDEMQRDLKKLRVFSHASADLRNEMEDFHRITNNIDSKGMFVLTFNELKDLGFN